MAPLLWSETAPSPATEQKSFLEKVVPPGAPCVSQAKEEENQVSDAASGLGMFEVPAQPFCPSWSGECGAESSCSTPDRAQKTDAIISPMQLEQLSDEAVVEQYHAERDIQRANELVNELFRRYYLKVARWCLRFTSDRESAAEWSQEICTKAYQNLSSFHGQSRFSTWLYAIARNHCLNEIRSRAPESESDEEILAALPASAASSPDVATQQWDDSRVVGMLLNQALDETEKSVFTLHYGEDLTLDAITRLLGLENASGAKAYLVSARRKLNRAVERWKARQQGVRE